MAVMVAMIIVSKGIRKGRGINTSPLFPLFVPLHSACKVRVIYLEKANPLVYGPSLACLLLDCIYILGEVFRVDSSSDGGGHNNDADDGGEV